MVTIQINNNASLGDLHDGMTWIRGDRAEGIQLTIFLISIGGHQLRHCLAAINGLLPGPPVLVSVVMNVSPTSRAYAEMTARCTTPFFVQLDEDMELLPGALTRFQEEIERWEPENFLADFLLIDTDLGVGDPPVIRSLKLYETKKIKAFSCHDENVAVTPSVDSVWHQPLLAAGKKIFDTGRTIGYHARHRNGFDLMLRHCKIISSRMDPRAKTNSGHVAKLQQGLGHDETATAYLRMVHAHFTTFAEVEPLRLARVVDVANGYVPNRRRASYGIPKERRELELPARLPSGFDLQAFLDLFDLRCDDRKRLFCVVALLCVATDNYAYDFRRYPTAIYDYFGWVLDGAEPPRVVQEGEDNAAKYQFPCFVDAVENVRLDFERRSYRISGAVANSLTYGVPLPAVITPSPRYVCSACGENVSYRKPASLQAHGRVHEDQSQALHPYLQGTFDTVEVVGGVPKVVYGCWFGHTPQLPLMSARRFEAFQSLAANIGVPFRLVSEENLDRYVVDGHPLHPAFEHLHGVHKADYARVYLLHHYGGGYHDVKFRLESWADAWRTEDWTENERVWIHGCRETNPEAVGHPPGEKEIQAQYGRLVTLSAVICRPATPFSEALLDAVEDTLDRHADELRRCPGRNPGGCYSRDPFAMATRGEYPLRWLQLLGEVAHPLMLRYADHILFGLSAPHPRRYK